MAEDEEEPARLHGFLQGFGEELGRLTLPHIDTLYLTTARHGGRGSGGVKRGERELCRRDKPCQLSHAVKETAEQAEDEKSDPASHLEVKRSASRKEEYLPRSSPRAKSSEKLGRS